MSRVKGACLAVLSLPNTCSDREFLCTISSGVLIGRIVATVWLVLGFALVSTPKVHGYSYWVPYVDTQHQGASVTYNSLFLTALEDSTQVQIDTMTMYLNSGITKEILRPLLREGLHITSNRPLQAFYRFITGNHGIYEDGGLQYSVLEESLVGTDYYVPTYNSVVSVLAVSDNTTINVGGSAYTRNAGQSLRLSTLAIGTKINSDQPVMVVVANFASDHYGSTFAYEVYPVGQLGNEYFLPHQHPHNYQSASDSSKVYVLGTTDSTTVLIGTDTVVVGRGQGIVRRCIGELTVTSDQPVYAVYVSDIYARDPWAGVFRHYEYALPMIPTAMASRDATIGLWYTDPSHGFPWVEVCVTSLKDGNLISLFTNGILRDTLTLNKSQRVYFHEGQVAEWGSAALHIKAEEVMQVTRTARHWWNGISENTYGLTILGLGYAHDVEVMAILSPNGVIPFDTTVIPTAIIKNYGDSAETFPAFFRIGSVSFDSIVVNLASREVDTVSFSGWTPDTVGSFGVRCYTDLPTDEYSGNDTIESVVAVIGDTAAPIVYSVAPNAGGNVGSVITTIHGQKFSQGASVRLICSGETDIVVDSAFISVVDSTTIIAGLVLVGKPLRSWDVVVTNPDQRSGVLRDGFQTLIGQRGLWTDIVSRDNLTAGRSGDLTVLIGNSGNVDAYGVVLELGGLPADVSIWPTFEMGYPDAQPEGWDSVSWADYPDFFIDSTGYSPSGLKDKRGYPALLTQFDALYLPVIPLHTTYSLRFGVNNPSAGVMNLYVLRTEPSMDYLMTQWEAQTISNLLCFSQISYEGLKLVFPYLTQELGSCVGDLTKQTVSVLSTLQIRWARENISGGKAKPQSLIQTLGAAGMSVLGSCVGVIPGGGASVIVLKGTAAAYSGYRSGQAIEAACTELFDLIQLVVKEIITNLPPRPIDPNDKAGPTGHGAFHHIPIEQQLQYVIYFENVDTATADARDVEILDSLSSGLDWSTFSFGEVFPGAGPDSIRPDFAYTTNFNPATGVISWTLSNINLPPDTMPYWGEGWVSYSIKPKSDLSSGTRIDNIAAIKFDVYDWILAPMDSVPIFNTIDAGTPTSSVSALPDTTRGCHFMVHWSGADEPKGSGIGSYSVYVSTDSGPYDLWISSTSLDTATYPGSIGHSYSFYSIARDNVGHVESKLPTSEARTTVTYMCGDANGDCAINISDVIYLIEYIFAGGPAPRPLAAGDVDCGGTINIADVVYLINYIFSHGLQPCAVCK